MKKTIKKDHYNWVLNKSAELGGGPVGILLLHGFTSTPGIMLELGEYLGARGFRVYIPRLPGHGTSIADMRAYHERDWVDCSRESLYLLKSKCERVAVCGLSMGGLLTLNLAAQEDLAAVSVLSAPLRYMSGIVQLARLVPFWPYYYYWPQREDYDSERPCYGYEGFSLKNLRDLLRLSGAVEKRLPDIHCPLQCIYTTQDAMVHIRTKDVLLDGIQSARTDVHVLHKSAHASTVGSEKDAVFQYVFNFFNRTCVVV